MLDWQGIVQNYIIKYSNRIKAATQPLKDHFGIGYFTYHRIDDEGKYSVLVDNPIWAEHYVGNQMYLNDPYLRQSKVYRPGLCLVDTNGSAQFKKTVMKEGKKILDLDVGVMLIQKENNAVEFFGFAGNKSTSSLQNIHLNHSHLLKSFANHFKTEMSSTIANMNEEGIFLPQLKGKDFFANQSISTEIDHVSRLGFYKDIGLKCDFEMFDKLTSRELDCLRLLLEEKSAKETGVALGISRRTVESYLDNIKAKFSCWGKYDILKIARTFRDVGLI